MTYPMSAILGFVQGVAEFLPISSSGHLTLFQHFFGLAEPDNLFNVLLHFATLLAVCIYYFQDVAEMIVEFFRGIAALFSRHPSPGNPPEARRLVLLVIVGTLPLFAVLLIKNKVEALGSNPYFVSCALLVTGCILFCSDRMAGGRKNARNATLKDVLLVGVAQGFATIPGLSRSGCTISAGMARGFDRKFAVRYSFLMSLPAVLGCDDSWRSRTFWSGRRSAGRETTHIPDGYGHRRRGGLFLHRTGQPVGIQGQVWRVCLLLLGRRPALSGPMRHGVDANVGYDLIFLER